MQTQSMDGVFNIKQESSMNSYYGGCLLIFKKKWLLSLKLKTLLHSIFLLLCWVFYCCSRSFDKHIIAARGGKIVFSIKSIKSNTDCGLFLFATWVQIGNCFSFTKFTDPFFFLNQPTIEKPLACLLKTIYKNLWYPHITFPFYYLRCLMQLTKKNTLDSKKEGGPGMCSTEHTKL